MGRLALQTLDIAFFAFHTVLVLFNLLGWAWPKWRPWNLATLAATTFSWFVMGIWFGWGYCLCTDWHFQIRRQLGYVDDSPTYIHLMIKLISGANMDPNLVQVITASGFIFGLLMSLITNLRDLRSRRRQTA